MATAYFTDELKTRVTRSMKRDLVRRANLRELDLSDVVREAIREYIAKREPSEAAPEIEVHA